MVTEHDVVARWHPGIPRSVDRGAWADPVVPDGCLRCGHAADVHVAAEAETSAWCRLCYAHPERHASHRHAFAA